MRAIVFFNIINSRYLRVEILFWFFMVVLLSICLRYASIVATSIAAHFALCHAL